MMINAMPSWLLRDDSNAGLHEGFSPHVSCDYGTVEEQKLRLLVASDESKPSQCHTQICKVESLLHRSRSAIDGETRFPPGPDGSERCAAILVVHGSHHKAELLLLEDALANHGFPPDAKPWDGQLSYNKSTPITSSFDICWMVDDHSSRSSFPCPFLTGEGAAI